METIIAVILILIGGAVVIGGMIAYNAFCYGLITLKFWSWFVLPVFITLPVLTFYQAIGIALFMSLMKGSSSQSFNKQFKDKYLDTKEMMIFYFAKPWMILLVGYIVHLIIK